MYNSTIIVKKKLLKCGHTDYNFSKGRCKQCATIEDTLKRMNEADETDEGISDLIRKADAVFSKYIRLKYSKNGIVKCFTCDKSMTVAEAQNGHYISRYNLYLRFDERNCKPQCCICNQHQHGNLLEYAKRLEKEREGITEILYNEAKIIYKYSRVELIIMINDFEGKIKLLQ